MRRLLPLACLLAACQPNPDPAQAGFFSGLANIATGTYERRAAAQQAQLEGTSRQGLTLREEVQERQAELARLQAERTALERRLGRLRTDLAGMRQELDAARARQGADQARLASLAAQLAALEQASARLEQGHEESERLARAIAEAEARRARLRAVMDEALATERAARPAPGS